ncbi:hypothetical protein GCM10029976_006890 [Kribbella albertanoniae]|uniref:Uncharacterized protein n=1 Tax=Kribbella albertanoniae TaxID=1266829 RepID=A0A4R4P997_9ACTN|nr:hypothetical protein [Kribbella albertanoniae]TDC19118.1 hypothetical protein E1261_34515 [Kribbella albertanoniae]
MRQAWGFRAARAAMFAATCVLLAALGHVLMSGTPIPGWAIVLAFAVVGTAAWFVTDCERGIPFVLVSTVMVQAMLHTVFTTAQAHPVTPPMTPGHEMTGTSSYGMLAVHLVAALLSGLWLAYGERAVFTVLRSVATRLLVSLRLIAQPLFTPHQPRIQQHYSPRPLRLFLLVHAIISRGPPRGVPVN